MSNPHSSAGSNTWAQFERRMRVRRELTCAALLRQAIDAGDYARALERARELAAIDSGWNEIRQALEDVVGALRARVRPPVAPRIVEPLLDLPLSAREAGLRPPASDPTHPPSPRSFAFSVAVLMAVLVLAAVFGWSLARVVPGSVGRWFAPIFQQSPRAATPPPVLPAGREVPDLPVSVGPTTQPTAGQATAGNASSQFGHGEGTFGGSNGEPGTSPPAGAEASARNGAGRGVTPAVGRGVTPAVGRGFSPAGTSPAEPRPLPQILRMPTLRDPALLQAPVPNDGDNTLKPGFATSGETAPVPPATPPASSATETVSSTSARSWATDRPDPTSAGTENREQASQQDDQRAISSALAAYERAYSSLDARAVLRVWPRVDADALQKAFQQLDVQRVAFSGCNVNVEGLRAAATCRGTATYVPKVGNGERVILQRTWQFYLRRFGDGWLIDSASVR